MKHHIFTRIVNNLHVTTQYVFLLFFFISPFIYPMEKEPILEELVLLPSLPNDMIIKIFACTDLETKERLRLTCSYLYMLDIKNILKHSPLIIARKDYLYHLIKTAKNNDSETFINLLYNATNCDYPDICTTASYFLPYNSTELKLLDIYSTTTMSKQLLPHIMAIYKGDVQTIEQYITKHMKNPEERKGMNPLNIAVHHPYAICELLLTQNIDLLNTPDYNDQYPLLVVAQANNINICEYLLSFKEIKINIFNKDGITPLSIATLNNQIDMVKLIINHSDTNINDQEGNSFTALHWAAIYNNQSIAKLLLQNYADINSQTYENETPIWYAVHAGHADMVELLLTYTLDVNIATIDGNTPLCEAAYNNNITIIRMLINYGANPNIRLSERSETPLHVAVTNNNYDAVELLLENDAQVDATVLSETPLFIAAEKGFLPIVKLLLKHGANINHQSDIKRTALYFALLFKHKETIRFLLEQPDIIFGPHDTVMLTDFKNSQEKK